MLSLHRQQVLSPLCLDYRVWRLWTALLEFYFFLFFLNEATRQAGAAVVHARTHTHARTVVSGAAVSSIGRVRVLQNSPVSATVPILVSVSGHL